MLYAYYHKIDFEKATININHETLKQLVNIQVYVFLKNLILCSCHNVAAMILHMYFRGWVAEFNFGEVSLPKELSAALMKLHQVVCKPRETKQSITILSNELMNSLICM